MVPLAFHLTRCLPTVRDSAYSDPLTRLGRPEGLRYITLRRCGRCSAELQLCCTCLSNRSRHETVKILVFLALLLTGWIVAAQEAEDRTLLTWATCAPSSTRPRRVAMHHVARARASYPRVRPAPSTKAFPRSEVVARFAREYGFSEVGTRVVPLAAAPVAAQPGELWMVEPQVNKLYDNLRRGGVARANSASGDVTAELVDVGTVRARRTYEGKDVKGKIVLGSAGRRPDLRPGVSARRGRGDRLQLVAPR